MVHFQEIFHLVNYAEVTKNPVRSVTYCTPLELFDLLHDAIYPV